MPEIQRQQLSFKLLNILNHKGEPRFAPVYDLCVVGVLHRSKFYIHQLVGFLYEIGLLVCDSVLLVVGFARIHC